MKAGFFYADDGVVTSTDPGWLQSVLDFVTGVFDRVRLCTNVCNTMGVVCRPCRESGVQENKAYTRRMMVEGRSYKEQQRERQRERFSCPYCRKDLAKGSLVMHRQTQHGLDKGGLDSEVDKADGGIDDPRSYIMAFPTRAGIGPSQSKGVVVGRRRRRR